MRFIDKESLFNQKSMKNMKNKNFMLFMTFRLVLASFPNSVWGRNCPETLFRLNRKQSLLRKCVSNLQIGNERVRA